MYNEWLRPLNTNKGSQSETDSTDKMIHADYYIYVGLLRGSCRISECFRDKDCVTLFHGNTRCKHKHIIQNIENILLNYGQNLK